MKPHVAQPVPLFGKTGQRYGVVVQNKEGISAGEKAGNFIKSPVYIQTKILVNLAYNIPYP